MYNNKTLKFMESKKLTSVKVEQELLQEFKEQCVRYKFTLQKLVDRAIFLYITEEEFRNKLHNQTNIKLK
jgi:hypothetical protein